MPQLPTLFISHGAPDLVLHPLPARDFLATVATRFARPRAIVVASAHYDPGPIAHVTVAAAPRTIHDFGGFDPSLYAMHYRAPGAPELAHQMVALLQAMVALAGLTRKGFAAGDVSALMSPRTLISWAENLLIFGDVALAFTLAFANKCDEAERPVLGEYFQRCFARELDQPYPLTLDGE